LTQTGLPAIALARGDPAYRFLARAVSCGKEMDPNETALVTAAPDAFTIPIQTIGDISRLAHEPLCHL
jgi:hypothetical protein